MSKDYPLPASQIEVARLRMQSDLFREDAASMLDRIGVQAGWRCLDLCCGVGGAPDLLSRRVGQNGEVTGLDMDSWKLDVAREWARVNLLPADDTRHSAEARQPYRVDSSSRPRARRSLRPKRRFARPTGTRSGAPCRC